LVYATLDILTRCVLERHLAEHKDDVDSLFMGVEDLSAPFGRRAAGHPLTT
jgi:hypothetical protein